MKLLDIFRRDNDRRPAGGSLGVLRDRSSSRSALLSRAAGGERSGRTRRQGASVGLKPEKKNRRMRNGTIPKKKKEKWTRKKKTGARGWTWQSQGKEQREISIEN